MATALRQVWQQGYHWQDFRADSMAGLTVGIIAIPMAMALAIASGVSPERGLYTAMIAGPIIALLGGSRLSVAGPTAAFVAVLYPVVQTYGLQGLLVATLMAGFLLIFLGIFRLGKFIEYIPYSAVIGFTAGIAVVIAGLQLKDFFGLSLPSQPIHFLDRMKVIFPALIDGANFSLGDTIIGSISILVLIFWPKLKFKIRIPKHLIAIFLSICATLLLKRIYPDCTIETIASRFHAIPQSLPNFILPWEFSNGQDLSSFKSEFWLQLMVPAISIALLGAIESLLCATILDGLSKEKHQPNSELIAQGIGNIVIPFFGGISATSAIARSIVNFRSGGRSPISSVIHGLFIFGVMVLMAPLFVYLPMATLAAMLLKTAWNMSHIYECLVLIRLGSIRDMMVLLASFMLTVIFDMVVGISVGLILAMCLKFRWGFLRRRLSDPNA